MQKEAVVGVEVAMPKFNQGLFCHLDGLKPQEREKRRKLVLKKLGLLDADIIPVFEEATQTAARFIESPICLLSLIVGEDVYLKSAVGLSKLGLMNQLAAERRIDRSDSFTTHVVDTQKNLIIEDTILDEFFAHNFLVQHYGIRSYLGIPLITATGETIGALEVIDLSPRQFTSKEVDFLTLTSRWCLREFEQNHYLKNHSSYSSVSKPNLLTGENHLLLTDDGIDINTSNIKIKLLKGLTEKLLTPLTSVIGMASVLRQEVYGPLTTKQKEYLEIVHKSGQSMISLVEEIVTIGSLDDNLFQAKLSCVDIEVLCQQIVNSLQVMTKQQQQKVYLSVEEGNRFWLLNKEKIRQTIYYLVMGVLETADASSQLRIHISHQTQTISFIVNIPEPWVEDGESEIPQSSRPLNPIFFLHRKNSTKNSFDSKDIPLKSVIIKALTEIDNTNQKKSSSNLLKESSEQYSLPIIGLLFSCYLAETDGGSILVNYSGSDYRCILKLPKITSSEINNSNLA